MKSRLTILLALLVCSALFFTSCGISISDMDISIGVSNYRYDHSGMYSAGDATLEDTVRYLDISWISGDVVIEYHDGAEVMAEEKSDHSLTDDEIMRYWLDGETLHIKYMASGVYKNMPKDKELIVKLPADSNLMDVEIETVSADMEIIAIKTNDLDIETVSGNILFEDLAIIREAEISNVSGMIKGTLSANEFSFENVSGNIEISCKDVREISASNVSGNVIVLCEIAPEDLDIETVSGNASVFLPKDCEFSVKFASVSGKLDSDFPMTVKGKIYSFGISDLEYEIETVSGDAALFYLIIEK